MFKKSFWVPYEDSTNYPTLAKTIDAISNYCEENGESYTFINDDEVEISGKRYEIYRGYEKYKWEVVKCFQDNWDVNATDFADMLTRSLSKTYNLLTSMNNFSAKMI